MIEQIVTPVLTLIIAYLVRYVFRWLKVDIDEKTYNAIVAALVVYLLGLLGLTVTQSLAPALFR